MSARKYIATKLHKALEMAPDDEDLAAMTNAPHYVVDRKLIEMFGREDVNRSIAALIEAGICRLPYEQLVVEFEAEDGVRRFAHLREKPDGSVSCTMAVLNAPALTVTSHPITVSIKSDPETAFVVSGGKSSELDKLAAAFATAVALLMLNTKGIEKELLQPVALNEAREKRGMPAIPRHTVMRIGTVVDALGRERSFSESRHMPLHLRAGHVRHQVCGKGRADRKLVYIPPTLVNFNPAEPDHKAPLPKRILSK